MRLLLLLSAILAALTGAGGGTRAIAAPAVTATSTAGARSPAAAHVVLTRSVAAAPLRRPVLRLAAEPSPVLLPARPLYRERRRE